MKLLLLGCWVFWALLSCQSQTMNTKLDPELAGVSIDQSIIAVIPYRPNQRPMMGIQEEVKGTELKEEDLLWIEKLLATCIDTYNEEKAAEIAHIRTEFPERNIKEKYILLDLPRYKRQYVAMMNKEGEKIVWVNAFCDDWDQNWRKELMFVLDGGNCYFNLKINLTTRTCFDLWVNGEA